MLNKVILIGRLTREPELRYSTNGIAVAKMNIAVERPQFNKEKDKQTDFIDVITWQRLAEVCANNLGKGRLIAVEGRLQIRSYDDKQGVRRKAAEVVAETVKFLDWPKDREGQVSEGSFGSEISFNGDDIPF